MNIRTNCNVTELPMKL